MIEENPKVNYLGNNKIEYILRNLFMLKKLETHTSVVAGIRC